MKSFERRSWRFRGLAAACVLLCASAAAEDLGRIGPVYPVGEQSALETILQRLKEKERSGELKRMEKDAIRRSIGSIRNPRPVAGVTTVLQASRRLLDPSVTYPNAITTDEGRVVVPAGARINPLLVTALTKKLVFFDGRDAAQVAAVHKLVSAGSARIRPILVAGSWYDTSRAWKTQVYFDQQGRLSQRFGITAVPTVVSQQGAMLLVEEVPAAELR